MRKADRLRSFLGGAEQQTQETIMAYTLSIAFAGNNGLGGYLPSDTVQATLSLAGTDLDSGTQNISNSGYTALESGACTYPCRVLIVNRDTANNVSIYKDNAGAHKIDELAPGEAFFASRAPAAYYLQFATATGQIYRKIAEV